MSRSETYRPAYLSEEQRQELARRARQERFRADLLPTLREHVRRQAAELHDHGSLPAPARIELDRRLEATTTAAGLRTLAMSLPRLHEPESAVTRSRVAPVNRGTGGHLASSGGLAPSARLEPAARLTPSAATFSSSPSIDDLALEFDLAHITAELASLQRTVEGLHLSTPLLPAAAAATEAAARAVTAAHPASARAALDEVVNDALVAAEQGARATSAVASVLEQMGFGVDRSVTEEGSLILFGRRVDGRAAHVELSHDGETTAFNARFTDEDDAVPLVDRCAGEVCDRAVGDSFEFHKRLAVEAEGLSLGPVEATSRPLRGSATVAPSSRARILKTTTKTTNTRSNP